MPVIERMMPGVRAANLRIAATYGATLPEHMEVFQRQVDALRRGESYWSADELLRQVRAGEKAPTDEEIAEHDRMLVAIRARPPPVAEVQFP